MPDLRDGEEIEVPGSSGNRYTVKNVGGVYACSCMPSRTPSPPVDRRTWQHLRRLRGGAGRRRAPAAAAEAGGVGVGDGGPAAVFFSSPLEGEVGERSEPGGG